MLRMNSAASLPPSAPEGLFGRVVSIVEGARGNIVRVVNSQMVLAYWLIGREIVQELQGGEERAEYGKNIVEELSARLTERYGKGFSATNLWYFRQFYLAYQHHENILRPLGGELPAPQQPAWAGDKPHGFSPQLTWSHYRALMRVAPPFRPPLQGLESFLAFVPRALPWAGIECPFRAVHANIQRMLTAKTKRQITHHDHARGKPSKAPTG